MKRFTSLELSIRLKKEGQWGNDSLVIMNDQRLKRTFGFSLRCKNESSRSNEMIAKVNILNRMLDLGRAEYVA